MKLKYLSLLLLLIIPTVAFAQITDEPQSEIIRTLLLHSTKIDTINSVIDVQDQKIASLEAKIVQLGKTPILYAPEIKQVQLPGKHYLVPFLVCENTDALVAIADYRDTDAVFSHTQLTTTRINSTWALYNIGTDVPALCIHDTLIPQIAPVTTR